MPFQASIPSRRRPAPALTLPVVSGLHVDLLAILVVLSILLVLVQ
jgi:hypothetical protein